MTPREKQVLAYQFAFWPEALNTRLHAWERDPSSPTADELDALDNAARLHLPLPETGYASFRHIARLAVYQALSCQYSMRSFVNNLRRFLGRPPLSESHCPPDLLADVPIPGITDEVIASVFAHA